jgi:hypothetical protein
LLAVAMKETQAYGLAKARAEQIAPEQVEEALT